MSRRFAERVTMHEVDGRVVLWHGLTGRSAALSPETAAELQRWTRGLSPPPDLHGVAQRLERLHLLAESPQPEPSRLVPARSRLVLVLPDVPALWLPLPAMRTPGGHAYAERRVSPDELALWRACNGSRDVTAVARVAGVTVRQALEFFEELAHFEVQALQLRDRPVDPWDPGLARLVEPERPSAPRPTDVRGPEGETTLSHWRRHDIIDGEYHTDDRETTVAHALAVPHPGLGGERYGERLHRVLEERGLLPTGDGAVLEIGPGELGEAWLARSAARGIPRGDLVRLDQSPNLLATQGKRQPGTREVLGNATELPFADGSLHLVLCNEVIADLSAVLYDPQDPDPGPAARAVADRLARYRIAPLCRGVTLYNLGAWVLVEELSRVLVPGGVAWLCEFGELDEPPRETLQLDHPEVSIHFGHLAAVARGCGLSCRIEGLAEFLGVDLSSRWLSRSSYQALRARCRSLGVHLAARAWTEETLSLPFPVEGLTWVSLRDEGPGPLVTRFQAVTLRKA